ncbi:MAG: nucleoside-diphosphate sugar epimerase [Parcubacteria group bacterium]|jgi:nucleoside-diphosphate-sugar epimerase|nr:nucleoside-diphosphate sugar epimerase [Parcubacteria group bacterium]|tara:strand:+ start:6795 stop:7703 length:909 start_codon:yes stop_codon:yes gene_type:complete
MKKVLVTGALGHIGSKLIREIEAEEIILVDNLVTQRYASLFNLPTDKKYQFIQGDILDTALPLDGVEAVIHLAAITDATYSTKEPEEVERVNLDGLKKVADQCLEKNVKLIFPSTTSVYGSKESIVDETSEVNSQSPYAQSKIDAEKYLAELKIKGLKYVICRFGTIFGWSVGMRFHTAVNKFTWQAVNSQPVTVWQTAMDQKRPYLDLADCVKAINLILNKDIFDEEIYNVVTANLAVKDIIETIKKFIPDLEVKMVESEIMNQLSYDVKIDKIAQKGFTAQGDLEEGIATTINNLKGIQK